MAKLDELVPNYHRAQRQWSSAPTLRNHYEALSVCFSGNGYGLVDHVKSFIESVCLTIMGELRVPMPSSTPTTTELLVAALSPLGLRNTKGANKLDKVLSGFNRLSDALNEMRNETGPVAHGKDGFLDPLTANHARIFLLVGDAILGVLLNAFEGHEPDLSVTREPYECFPHLNERIDRAVSVVARVDEDEDRQVVIFSVATGPMDEGIELRVEPSRLLYGIDREAYIEVLKSVDLFFEKVDIESEQFEPKVEAPEYAVAHWTSVREGPSPVLTPSYKGEIEPFRHGLEAFLTAEGVSKTGDNDNRLIDSLLATIEENTGIDWKERKAIQARLKVACKRVLAHFGLDTGEADAVAGRLVAWLRVQLENSNTVNTDSPYASGGVES